MNKSLLGCASLVAILGTELAPIISDESHHELPDHIPEARYIFRVPNVVAFGISGTTKIRLSNELYV